MENDYDFLLKFAVTSYISAYKILLILKENEARKKGNFELANRYKRALKKLAEIEREENFYRKVRR